MDFPTLGIPATMARRGRPTIPRALSRAIFSLQASWTKRRTTSPALRSRASAETASIPLLRKYSSNCSVFAGSARSALHKRTMISAAQRDSGIHQFDHEVDKTDVFFHHASRFRHMSRVPLILHCALLFPKEAGRRRHRHPLIHCPHTGPVRRMGGTLTFRRSIHHTGPARCMGGTLTLRRQYTIPAFPPQARTITFGRPCQKESAVPKQARHSR